MGRGEEENCHLSYLPYKEELKERFILVLRSEAGKRNHIQV